MTERTILHESHRRGERRETSCPVRAFWKFSSVSPWQKYELAARFCIDNRLQISSYRQNSKIAALRGPNRVGSKTTCTSTVGECGEVLARGNLALALGRAGIACLRDPGLRHGPDGLESSPRQPRKRGPQTHFFASVHGNCSLFLLFLGVPRCLSVRLLRVGVNQSCTKCVSPPA